MRTGWLLLQLVVVVSSQGVESLTGNEKSLKGMLKNHYQNTTMNITNRGKFRVNNDSFLKFLLPHFRSHAAVDNNE